LVLGLRGPAEFELHRRLPDVTLAEKAVESLSRQVASAARKFLVVEDDDLLADLHAEDRRLKDELEEARQRLEVLRAVGSHGLSPSCGWWEREKGEFAFALPNVLTDSPTRFLVVLRHLDPDRTRATLRGVGLRATVAMKPIPGGRRVGRRAWELKRVGVSVSLAECMNAVRDHSSTNRHNVLARSFTVRPAGLSKKVVEKRAGGSLQALTARV
jgi:hypothetical protein